MKAQISLIISWCLSCVAFPPSVLQRECDALATSHIFTHYTCVSLILTLTNMTPAGKHFCGHIIYVWYNSAAECNQMDHIGVPGHLLWIDSWTLWFTLRDYFNPSLAPHYSWIGLKRLNFTTADPPGW
jgi:hypothetical protein